MHTFDEYAPQSDAQQLDLITRHPFALLVSAVGGTPIATHIPVIPASVTAGGPDETGELAGRLLWGHMAKANPQWRDLAEQPEVLLVFTAEHAYVSAAHYQRTPSVPTWNYSAVHITARPELITEPDETLEVLTSTVRACEATEGSHWDQSTSVDHFRRILSGVVAFRLRVSRVQGVVKLSQDKSIPLWERVHDAFSESPDIGRRRLAEQMTAVRPSGTDQ